MNFIVASPTQLIDRYDKRHEADVIARKLAAANPGTEYKVYIEIWTVYVPTANEKERKEFWS